MAHAGWRQAGRWIAQLAMTSGWTGAMLFGAAVAAGRLLGRQREGLLRGREELLEFRNIRSLLRAALGAAFAEGIDVCLSSYSARDH